jgi:hypothetical protein
MGRIRVELENCYLRAAGDRSAAGGCLGRRPPAKPANEVTTESDAAKPINPNPNTLLIRERQKAESATNRFRCHAVGFTDKLEDRPEARLIKPPWYESRP